MDHNIVEYIISLFAYQTLCEATQVSKQWHDMSQKQLKIRHELDPILPILHNRATHNQFIQSLYNFYHNFIIYNAYSSLSRFITGINGSYKYGINNAEFISSWSTISDQIESIFDALYKYTIIKINKVKKTEMCKLKFHDIRTISSRIQLFEKGFAILMYFKSLLNTVYDDWDEFTYDEFENYSIIWNIDLIDVGKFNK